MAEIDSSSLKETFLRLKESVRSYTKRRLVNSIALGKEPRIKVIRGFRGVGKTTAMLQIADEKSIYFSMDNPLVQKYSLYELGKYFVLAGYSVIFIDEVHHSKNWKEDSKALYDEFPFVSIVISGSAPLAFEPERRYDIIEAEPLSLSEYASLCESPLPSPLPDADWQSVESAIRFLSSNPSTYARYKEYMEGGAFPLYFTYKEKTLDGISAGIWKSVREDAVFLGNSNSA
ncbi:MAG: AAA family ATPase [Candidatus Micrarchaeota archaeon]